MSQLLDNSIYWIETDNIVANPYQPRKAFDESTIKDLSESIRQYGILQPLTVTEGTDPATGEKRYELIAGERRLRASKMAGLRQVPVIVRTGDDTKTKFELAIIENLQREDLNPIDRAEAFQQLYDEFGLSHAQIGKKMGKSRVYVSNSLRLLKLPEYIRQAVKEGKITEGHTRPLMMLDDRPEEQRTLFKEIMLKKMSVRESEKIARKIAQDRVRKKSLKQDPKLARIEKEFSEKLGTRVSIEEGKVGGKVVIDYFTEDDLEGLLDLIQTSGGVGNAKAMMQKYAKEQAAQNNQAVASFEKTYEKPVDTQIPERVSGVVTENQTMSHAPLRTMMEIYESMMEGKNNTLAVLHHPETPDDQEYIVKEFTI